MPIPATKATPPSAPDNVREALLSGASFYLADRLSDLPAPAEGQIRILLISERCLLRLNGSLTVCSPGNILITKSGYPVEEEDAPVPSLLLTEDFFDSLFFSQIMDCPLFFDFLRTPSKQGRLLYFDCSPASMDWAIAKILFYEAAKGPAGGKAVHAACTLLLSELHQCHRQKLLIGRSAMMTENKIGAVLTYISDHYRDITLESAAAAFHYHPAYFSAWFKKHAHVTFQQELLKIRLEQARFLLRETRLPVQTILEEVGFQEKSHFHRFFKRECQMTPLAYRKMCQAGGVAHIPNSLSSSASTSSAV